MGQPAAVSGDQVNAVCSLHLMPNPATGAPQPAPPLPFAAPITLGVCATVLVCGSPAVVVGATGVNTPPHVGLHPSDPYMVPTMQKGQVVSGSQTVLFGGQPAASATSTCTCCATSGQITPTVTDVLIG